MDEDGYIYFVDRRKDIIESGGENVSSQEPEWEDSEEHIERKVCGFRGKMTG